MTETKKILILGIGNTLLSDEGFGVHAVEYLQRQYRWPDNIQLVDGGTRGLLLMTELMECDFALVLDVARGGETPGTFYLLEDRDLDKALSFRESMHQTGLSDILISCELAGYRPEAVVLAMEPFDIESPGEQLTQAAKDRLPEFCAMAIALLEQRELVRKGDIVAAWEQTDSTPLTNQGFTNAS